MEQEPWHGDSVHAQRPRRQVLRGARRAGGAAGAQVLPAAQRAAWPPGSTGPPLQQRARPASTPSSVCTMRPPAPPHSPAGPDRVPGVAVHRDLVPGGVQVLVVRTRALGLLDAAAAAVVHQPVRADAAADALCLVLQGAGEGTAGFRPRWPSRPLLEPPPFLLCGHPFLPCPPDLCALSLGLTTGPGDRRRLPARGPHTAPSPPWAGRGPLGRGGPRRPMRVRDPAAGPQGQ